MIETKKIAQTSPHRIPRVNRQGTLYLTGFHTIPPRFTTSQAELLDWLVEAHVHTGGLGRDALTSMFARHSASSEHIAFRGHELEDFSHRRWEEMELFSPKGSDLGEKTKFFEESVNMIFTRLYSAHAAPPGAIVHVTCTGYVSPSGAQRLVSLRNWGRRTQVLHAYHMGCYAAHPAVRMAAGLSVSAFESIEPIDIVHTELCSLHLDPKLHDPAQLIIQSLFADGFIKYQMKNSALADSVHEPRLELLAGREEIIPNSEGAMAWWTGPMNFQMDLSKEVPTLLASSLPRFIKTIVDEAGLDWGQEKDHLLLAIHPGGPSIIELSQRVLSARPDQVRHSRQILREHGNMSSATLPHIWQRILLDPDVPDGTLVASLGAGPGLTLSGLLFRKKDN